MKNRVGVLVLGLLLGSAGALRAQSANASLSGTVVDATGAIVAGTEVAAQNTQTGVVLNTTSNSAGLFAFPSVLPGTYRLTGTKSGFRQAVLNDVRLEVGGRARATLEGGMRHFREAQAQQVLVQKACLDYRLVLRCCWGGNI